MLFLSCALTSELIGVKIFSLEQSWGIKPLDYSLFGVEHLSFNLSVGVILWPIIFILTDVINDYYGLKGVRLITWLSTGFISLMFVFLFFAISLSPAEFWISSKQDYGLPNMQLAFRHIFGQGMNIIVASLVAFVVGQFTDAYVFRKIKIMYKGRYIWLRATVSTLFSQLIDSFVVTYIAFYVAQDFPFVVVTSWALNAYIYKFSMALLLSPLIYVFHFGVKKYLSKDIAIQMRANSL